jgi:hypothetical protein
VFQRFAEVDGFSVGAGDGAAVDGAVQLGGLSPNQRPAMKL